MSVSLGHTCGGISIGIRCKNELEVRLAPRLSLVSRKGVHSEPILVLHAFNIEHSRVRGVTVGREAGGERDT